MNGIYGVEFHETFLHVESITGLGVAVALASLLAWGVSSIMQARTAYLAVPMAMLIGYLTVQWTSPSGWMEVLWWTSWAALLLAWLASCGAGNISRKTAILALLGVGLSVVLFGHGEIPYARQSDVSALAADLTRQQSDLAKKMTSDLDATNAQLAVINSRLDGIDARVTALENGQKATDTRVKTLETVVGGITYTSLAGDMSPDQQNKAILELASELAKAGWNKGDFTFGQVDWSKNVYDAGSRKFSPNWINSSANIGEFLGSSSAESQAAAGHLKSVLPDGEYARAMNGNGFIPIQFNREACLTGNGYFLDGYKVGGQTCHSAGDVVWVYIAQDGTVYWDASIRADCANPGMTEIPTPQAVNRHVPVVKPHKGDTTPTGSCKSTQTGTYPNCVDRKVA